ncbi:FliM/FliN family flagellar motor switch protein [Caulobacter endophyticus]|uniref:FliM/FliN family flagellar motor switch protein n=1 Tax=Caulobacter endophyticus TaxID=2172652 RepID=UPI00240F2404|nr:FliM/FliN family flagellar motor switch protein [Caulobacter endophyticus]MDG2528521.1 FliM/FliN family flagellar motor switch protein [Caulobacter endophyticus]
MTASLDLQAGEGASPAAADLSDLVARNHALAVLAALRAPGLVTRVALDAEVGAGPWILFGEDEPSLRLAIRDLSGAAFASADDAELLVALDRIEPVLAAIEAATTESLSPLGVEADAPDGLLALSIVVEAQDSAPFARLVLAVDPEVARAWPQPIFDPWAPGAHLAVPATGPLVLDGPELPAQTAAALRPGDIVLTPLSASRPGLAALTLFDRRLVGRFELSHRRFTLNAIEESAMSPPLDIAVAPTEDAAPDAAPVAPADLPVPLKVLLGEASLPLSELAGLRPGSTVVLAGPREDAPVVLLAGDRAIARGRLVPVGGAWGVLVETIGGEG